jgi:asparagine synthase (glutamine-hydrolysing)
VCGLAGCYGNGPLETVTGTVTALERIAHRGPDGMGVVTVGDAILGHVRLAIQDTSDAAAQPFLRGSVTLTYNGETWNHEELRAGLDGPWTSTGDTDTIAALLDQRGAAGLDQVHGMFALAWADEDGVHLARDRYGKIPLYVRRTGPQSWAWASELKALPPGPAHAVAPGSVLHLPSGRSERWATNAPAPDASPVNVLSLLRAGVGARLLSDRPVCFLLSGGLDSSLVLALACELHPSPVAYTAVLDPASPDLAAARFVARELDVPLVEVPIDAPTTTSITEAVRCVEIPMKAQVEIALANLPLAHAIAADGFRVALSGEGADELFGGYGNMMIAAGKSDDAGYRAIKSGAVEKMGRGNFARVNKVFMHAGVEARLPFMHRPLVDLALAASKSASPPGKGLLKDAARGLVPESVIRRPKMTFQGGTGTSAAVAGLIASPTRYYNAEARRLFGWLPNGY